MKYYLFIAFVLLTYILININEGGGEEEEEEDWPPSEDQYDPLAPLLLPFGPRSVKTRMRVANAVSRVEWVVG